MYNDEMITEKTEERRFPSLIATLYGFRVNQRGCLFYPRKESAVVCRDRDQIRIIIKGDIFNGRRDF